MQRELTGRHVFLITAAAFGVIIAVNLFMAWQAVATFPGLEVRNGYVASQSFEAERQAQLALGWSVETRVADGVIRLAFTGPDGAPADVASLEASFGRATSRANDQAPVFTALGAGVFEAAITPAPGHWVLQLRARSANGSAFRQRIAVWLR